MKSLITVHPFWYFYYHSSPPKKPFTEYLLGLKGVSEKKFDEKVLLGPDPEEVLNGKFDLKRADCDIKSVVKALKQYDMRLETPPDKTDILKTEIEKTELIKLKPTIAKSNDIYLTGSNMWDVGKYEGCIVAALELISDLVPKEDRMDNVFVFGYDEIHKRTVYLVEKAILLLPEGKIDLLKLTAQFMNMRKALQYNLQVLYGI
jgi:hypothetical protein